jgi:hypothetical protein
MLTAPTQSSGALHEEGCLFCRTHDGGFVSREHVFSEGLGNNENADNPKVLPPGVVCDRCNNGPLGLGDEALVNFAPIAMLRGERGLGSKSGKAPLAKFGNAQVAWTGRGELTVFSPKGKAMDVRPTPDGRVKGTLNLTSGGPVTAKRIRLMVRSVWKSAVELIYLDQGPEVAFDHTLDPAREAILNSRASGWALVPMDATPHQHVSLSYWYPCQVEGYEALPILFDVFGMVILTDALFRQERSIERPDRVNLWEF